MDHISHLKIIQYISYLLICISFTIWVGRNLFNNGKVFLLDAFDQNKQKADSVNQLLLVGFYLVNLGLVSFLLKVNGDIISYVSLIEVLSYKIGIQLIVLGGMHFFNMYNINNMRRKAVAKKHSAEAFYKANSTVAAPFAKNSVDYDESIQDLSALPLSVRT